MSFLRWICEIYLAPKRKRGKRKSVNQYWRDFKMLFKRINKGHEVDGDDASEVVKVPYPLPLLDFYCTLTVGRKYINTVLKVDFDLDNTPKPKPVVGPDDLLLLLVQHWARDESVFPTEDDRHDLATIMLFNAYTGGRPAEFVHASKGKASQDPLGEGDKTSKRERLPEATGKDYDDNSDAGDGLEHDRDEFFDDDGQDTFGNYDPSDKNMNIDVSTNSGYCSNGINNPISEDNCPIVNVDDTS